MSDSQTIATVQAWQPQIAQAAAPYNLPGLESAAMAIMAIESGGDPNVGCSPSQACGLMQVVGEGTVSTQQQITDGVDHLAGNYQQCHSWEGAAAAYFSGSCDTSSGASDSFGTTVSGYVSRFDQYLAEFGGATGSPLMLANQYSGSAGVTTAQLTAELTKGLKAGGLYLAAIGLLIAGVWVLW